MFLRRCKRRKNGKPHSYWALVESYRTARGSRQRVVAYLGELRPSERSGWAQLGRHLDQKARPQPSLFDPPGYETFDGNTHDSQTVEQIVQAMESKYGRAHRIWVMDRGMVSEANLVFLRHRGGAYIVGTPKSMLRQFERHLTEQDWHEVEEGVQVKWVAGPEGREVFVLARRQDRREKERAMHQRFLERCWRNSRRSRVATWSCRPEAEPVKATGGFACAVSPHPTRPKRPCSTGWV